MRKATRTVAAILTALVAPAAGGCSASNGVALQPPSSSVAAAAPAGKNGGELLYVSDVFNHLVYVYSYPHLVFKQTLAGVSDPFGECTDAHGNVFVVDTGNLDVLEYARGNATPKATLSDPGSVPLGCAVDPVTGDLAVTNRETNGGPGDVAIYRRGHTTPKKRFTNASFNEMVLCGYDPSGNLFVDGVTASERFVFGELPRGGKTLATVTLDERFASPGAVQWDGQYLAVGDESTGAIYRFSIDGQQGTTAGTTRLNGTNEIFQFSIRGSRVIGPNGGSGSVDIWKYPAGGTPVKGISGLREPVAVVISKP
jgi:DNA-binding beta-propeller fold protein YncE